MATKKIDAEITDITDEGTSFDVAEYERQELAKAEAFGDIRGVDEGERIELPSLKLTYGVGGLADAGYNDGDWVINGDTQVGSRKDPLIVTVVDAQKYWKEYLAWDPSGANRPRIFASEEEARAAGLSTRWQGSVGPQASEAARFNLLVQRGKDVVSGLFANLLGDEDEWLACEYYVDKGAYRGTFPNVFNATQLSLRSLRLPLQGGIFELGSRREKTASNNSRTVPYMRYIGAHDLKKAKAIRTLFSIE